WADDELAHLDNCFNPQAPQVALGIRMSHECFFAELGVEGNPWGRNPPELMRALAKRYNDRAEKIVGRRLVTETIHDPEDQFPYLKRIGEIFGGHYFYHDEIEWLEGDPASQTPEGLEKLLDHVEQLDIAAFITPPDWDARTRDIENRTGRKPDPHTLGGRGIRGPVTLATSIMGVENFLMLHYDAPDLLLRFSRVLGDAVLRRARAIDQLCHTDARATRGFSFADDNCSLTTPDLYETFGYPILKLLFDHYSPDENDPRYQHSDSDMGHLLPLLGRLRFTGVNFGPNVHLDHIRPHMPQARIDGCLAPFTFMNNDREKIIAEVRRDCAMAQASGAKGLNLSTAGSINNGSTLESMRLVMQVIQNYGRY
ncbi:MAG: hypothetical protein LBK99_15885, partial [Opitutaceae bacterium]|nr:hypothetical protein [Opitutaceae bacterium]